MDQSISNNTIADYLLAEETAADKHEFRDGQILAMSGGSPTHSLVIANVVGEARQQLKGKPCRIYESNLRIRVPRTLLYTYPDASIVCGPPQFDPNDTNQTTITNPKVVIEFVEMLLLTI